MYEMIGQVSTMLIVCGTIVFLLHFCNCVHDRVPDPDTESEPSNSRSKLTQILDVLWQTNVARTLKKQTNKQTEKSLIMLQSRTGQLVAPG